MTLLECEMERGLNKPFFFTLGNKAYEINLLIPFGILSLKLYLQSQISISKLTVFLGLRYWKTVHISDQLMSADKYPSTFSHQMEAIVYTYIPRRSDCYFFNAFGECAYQENSCPACHRKYSADTIHSTYVRRMMGILDVYTEYKTAILSSDGLAVFSMAWHKFTIASIWR